MQRFSVHEKWILLLTTMLSLLDEYSGQSTSIPPSPSPSPSPCDTLSAIRGSIVTISKSQGTTGGTAIGSIVINGTKEKTKAKYDTAYIIVRSDTQLFQKQGNVCQHISFTTLKVGQRIQVQASGSLQSYPPQVVAAEIVLLPLEP